MLGGFGVLGLFVASNVVYSMNFRDGDIDRYYMPTVAVAAPLLGAGVMAGAVLATRTPVHVDRRHALAVCYGVQAVGVVIGVWWPGVASFAIGSLLVGLPFTAISFFGMQEARRLSPAAPAGLMGLATAVYGVGQIAGPPLAAWLVGRSSVPAQGFSLAIDAAAASLVLGAALHVMLAWRWPASTR